MSVMTMLNKRGKCRPNIVQESQIIWDLEKAGYNPCKRSCLLVFCVYNVQSSILAIVACAGGEI